ncbi:polysaccharide deacetylase family protein [Paenibacillus sp. LHD-117]|uniref:polysaccharide deacetylase family protein n=1 Tax=Paenibacillus sp. LHD-117 TaxID=3071412 RepID=UPI0027DFE9E5|nr:polysaccharide deacetylase family protein [Paenibacillus sp. LHD-117]MDQ6419811.1 polysaccharide deacetylase family protein [Paenibacillus sp. LHD-117]
MRLAHLSKCFIFAATIVAFMFAAAPSVSAEHQSPNQSQSSREHAKSKQKKKQKKKQAIQKVDMSWVKLHRQYPSSFLVNGPRNQKRVALTFDDAPDPRFTPEILDVLARYRICATFFVVGDRAAKHPDLVRRIINEGHIIGNHSYNHAVFSKLTLNKFQNQIWQTDGIIRRIVGVSPLFIRPPYGELLPQQVKWGQGSGFTIVNWDVDSEDWRKNPTSAKVLANIRKTLQPGSIILQHAGGGEGQSLAGTIDALPVLIEQLQGKGYEMVTLPELLGKRPYR